jgi:hypothetical protein
VKPVIILGKGPSHTFADDLPDDIPVWTVNGEWYKRHDAMFDMHPYMDVVTSPRYKEYLEAKYPIYMLERYDDIPTSIEFPLEEMLDFVYGNMCRGEDKIRLMSSSLMYMVALAVWQGFDKIYCYGFEMQTSTEYQYQREGAYGILMWAAAQGVDVVLPPKSGLFPPGLYGYEDFQMIHRQELERMRGELQVELNMWLAKLNGVQRAITEYEKQMGEMSQNGKGKEAMEHLQALHAERLKAHNYTQLTQGAWQVVNHLIGLCDKREGALKLVDQVRND